MAQDALKNFSYSTVATAPSPATSGTSLVLHAGDGALFPDPSTDGSFNVTIWPASVQPTSTNAEIARVTARSTDTLTITRAQEGSSARSVIVGDQIALTVTKKTITDLRAAFMGGTSLIYRYTVTGSDKTSIDTGVDTPDAGSNDWTGGDLLEVYCYARTDEAVVTSVVDVTFNNDTSSVYDRSRTQNNTGTVTGNATNAANLPPFMAGASAAANEFGQFSIVIPNFAGTVGFKNGTILSGFADNPVTTTGYQQTFAFTYRSTSAITRLNVIPDTAAKKLKVGSQLLIYKRLAASL